MTARWCRAIVRIAAPLVPPTDRQEWRDEWLGELAYAWHEDRRPMSWRRRVSLTGRALAACRHALWLSIGKWTMDGVRRDVAGALRFARRQPGFALVAVATLALGIGANATIFSVINAVFLRPLPVGRPETLVALFTADTTYPGRLLPTSYLNFQDYRDAH